MLLHRYFHVNADKVGKELLSSSGPPVSQDSEQGPSGGKQTWDNLCATLVEIGAPLEIPKPSAIPASQHPRFQEFIQRNSHRNTDGVRDIFLESPVPKVCGCTCLWSLSDTLPIGSHPSLYPFAVQSEC